MFLLSNAACKGIFVLKRSLKKWSSTEQASNETVAKFLEVPFIKSRQIYVYIFFCYRFVCGQTQATRPLGYSRKENSNSIETT